MILPIPEECTCTTEPTWMPEASEERLPETVRPLNRRTEAEALLRLSTRPTMLPEEAEAEEASSTSPALFSVTVIPVSYTHLEGGGAFAVTTFRADCGYEDGRHPDRVRFLPELREDLRRRDFTINAMAMDAGGVLTDLCGGRERCV